MSQPGYPSLRHPVDRTQPPAFHEMNEHPKRFERMVAALMADDPTIKRARMFGVGGAKQYGVDAVGQCEDGLGKVVGSSKCYLRMTRAQLGSWSDEFLTEFESRWRARGVRRFILATAAQNVTSVEILDEIELEEARFSRFEIVYEVWGPEELTRRLQNSRPITQRFLGDIWANILCGPPPSVEATGGDLDISAALIAELHRAHTTLSAHVMSRLVQGREELKAGNESAVEAVLDEVRGRGTWPQLDDKARAFALRLAGSLALHREDVHEAKQLSESALALDPADRRLVARITNHESGPIEALEALGDAVSFEARQLKASLLLEAGEVDSARDLIQLLFSEGSENPETLRLTAYIQLLDGHRREALETIQAVEGWAGHWLSVIRAGAIIRYANVITPLAPAEMVIYPNPIGLQFVKTDDFSTRLLEEALLRFESLLAKSRTTADLALWKLGCLANLPARRHQAEAYCASLLKEDGLLVDAIAWAQMRDFAVDCAPSCAALLDLFERGAATRPQLRVLIWRLIKAESVEQILGRLRAVIDNQPDDVKAEAESWMRRLSGEPPGPDDEDSWVATGTLNRAISSAENQDYTHVENELSVLLSPGSASFLGFAFASSIAERGWWTAIAPHVPVLVSFETVAPTVLAAHVVCRTQPPAVALAFLADHQKVFPSNGVPAEWRRLEISSLVESGDLATAIQLAERLALETNAVFDRAHLAQCYLKAGAVQACIPTLRRLLDDSGLSSTEAIHYSVATAREDRELSRALWKYAAAREIPDVMLLPALTQAYKIGLDSEAHVLMPRLHQRAMSDSPDVWHVTLDDVVEHIRANRTRAENVQSLIEQGALAIHMALPRLGALAELFWLDRPHRARRPFGMFFIRHGARPVDVTQKAAWCDWNISIDITGLLLADQLDLLDEVEALAAPVKISHHLPDILYNLENDTSHQQIARISIARTIIAAQASGTLKLCEASYADSEAVQHERTEAEMSSAGPTIKSVELALAQVGAISLDLDGSRAELEANPLELIPPSGGRLVFPSNTLETIAAKGCLNALLQEFQCEIPKDDFDDVVAEVQMAEAGDALSDRMRNLRRRVADGLQARRYVFLPEHSATRSDKAVDAWKHRTPVEEGLLDIISAPAVENGMVWVDDRYLSGFTNASGNPVVGIVEVLNALAAAGRITEKQRREKLLRLREAGAGFIPLTVEEVLPLLREARLHKGKLVETPSLAILRRNLSASLRLDGKLKIAESDVQSLKGRPNEIPFLLASRKVVESCLVSAWSDREASLEERRAWSDWLWSNIRVEQFIDALPTEDPAGARELLSSLMMAGAIADAGMIICGTVGETIERQRAYMAWLEETVLRHRVGTGFWRRVADHLKGLIALPRDPSPVTGKAARMIASLRDHHLSILPDVVAEPLFSDPDFARRAEVTGGGYLITLDDLSFPSDRYWGAVLRALRSGKARTKSTDGRNVNFVSKDDVIVVSGGVQARLREPIYEVLRASTDARSAAIEKFVKTLDLAFEEAQELLKRCRTVRSDRQLIKYLREAEARSVVHFYHRMESSYRHTSQTSFSPPPVGDLLHHLRLDPLVEDFVPAAHRAWDILSAAIGPQFSYHRLAGFPVDLASHWAESDPQAAEFVLAGRNSPIARLHCAALAWRLGDATRADEQLGLLAESLDGEGRLFVAVLDWSYKAFQTDPLWWDISTAAKLALTWAHAHRVTTILVDHNADVENAARIFDEYLARRGPGEVLASLIDVERDCAAPGSLRASSLLYHGLGYVFGPEAEKELNLRKERLAPLWRVGEGGAGIELVLRSPLALNSLGSFLDQEATAVLEDGFVPSQFRSQQTNQALVEIEEGTNSLPAWSLLAALGKGGFSADETVRLNAAFDAVRLEAIHNDGNSSANRIPVDARMRSGAIDDTQLLGKIRDLAAFHGNTLTGRMDWDDGTPAFAIFSGVLEAAASTAAANSPAAALERFSRAVETIVQSWPSAARPLRELFDMLVRQGDPNQFGRVWSTYNWLRAWP